MADIAERVAEVTLAPEDAAFLEMSRRFERLAQANEEALQWDQDNGLDIFTAEGASDVTDVIEQLRKSARVMRKAAMDGVYSQSAAEEEEKLDGSD